MDEYFDKPPQPRRPLASDGAIRLACATAVFLGLLGFAHLHPDVALKVLGVAVSLGVCLIFVVLSNH